MTRNRGKKALYEVMSKARVKPDKNKIVEYSRPQKTVEESPVTRHKESAEVSKSAAKWWRKPRIVQLNAGRIEFSMPYQIAVVLVLVLIFMLIAAYRLGQVSYSAEGRAAGQPESVTREMNEERAIEQATSDIPQPSPPPENVTAKTEVAEPVEPMGNNVIVLAQYDRLADLSPVQAHFSEHGIELEIVPRSGRYFLQTKKLYDNPAKPGTDGYKALQKIIEVGKEYKAPLGYETFAPNYFSDAYGYKVK